MADFEVEKNSHNDIMTLEEVAKYFRKSQSWVYKNWRLLAAGSSGVL